MSSKELIEELALLEKLQQKDPNPLDVALAFKRLMEQRGLNQQELAEQIGKKRSTVANYLRLLALEEPIQKSLKGQKVTMGHAKALLSLNSTEARLLLHKRIERENLSVRVTEQLAKKAENLSSAAPASSEEGVHLRALTEELEGKLSTRVQLSGSYERGTLSIDYYSMEGLEQLLELLGRR